MPKKVIIASPNLQLSAELSQLALEDQSQVVVANSKDELMFQLQSPAIPNILVLDINLSELELPTLAEELKEIGESAKIILLVHDKPPENTPEIIDHVISYDRATKKFPLLLNCFDTISDEDEEQKDSDSKEQAKENKGNKPETVTRDKTSSSRPKEDKYAGLKTENGEEKSLLDGMHVLAVDDEESSRTLLQNYLESFDCQVSTAKDGFEALAVIRKMNNNNNKVKLIILDLMMQGMDGFEFLGTLRKRNWGKDIPVIVSSSRNDRNAVLKCKEGGITDYVIKPFYKSILYEKVVMALSAELGDEE